MATRVQTSSIVYLSATTSTTVALTGVAAGNKLVVDVFQTYGGNPPRTISSITDAGDSGASLTLGKHSESGGGGVFLDTYYRTATNAGTHTVTVTLSGTGDAIIIMTEYAGAGAINGTPVSNSGTSTTATPSALAPSGTNLYHGLALFSSSGSGLTTPSGWTINASQDSGSGSRAFSSHSLTSTGSQNPSTVYGASVEWAAHLLAFSDASGPSRSSGSINTAGTQLTVTYSEAVTHGAGGTGGVTLSASGGALTATYSSGAGSTSLVYTLSRTVLSSETITQSYTQPGNGIEASTGGIDVSSYTNQAVTNNSTVAGPSISGVSGSLVYNSSIVITGSNFNTTQSGGSVTIGGVTQTVTSWSATSITITVVRGTNQYGVSVDVVVTNGVTGYSGAYTVSAGIQPQAGWAFVNLTTPNTTSAYRITASGDLASGDQLAYNTHGLLVIVAADATFTADPSVTSFDVEAWTSGSGWGSIGTQTIGTPTNQTVSGQTASITVSVIAGSVTSGGSIVLGQTVVIQLTINRGGVSNGVNTGNKHRRVSIRLGLGL